MAPLSLRLPLRFLRAASLRLGLTIAALACGVALVCATDLVNRAVYAAFAEAIDTAAGRAALQLRADGDGLLREEIAELVEAVPGVAMAVPVVSAFAYAADGSGEVLAVHGIDVANDDVVRVYDSGAPAQLEDPLVFLSRPDSILLTSAYAQRMGLRLSDAVELETPTGRHRFVVRGLLSPTGIARLLAGNLVVMDVAAAQQAFARPGFVHRIDIVLTPEASRRDVADGITAVLPAGLRVEAPEERKLDLHAVLQSSQLLLRGVSLLGLLAAFFIAFSRLTTHFEARTWAHAVLRAVGVRERRVWIELVKESLLVGCGAMLAGVPLGIGLGYALLPLLARATLIGSNLPMTAPDLAVRPASIALAAALGLGAAVAAALVPSRRASRVPVPQALSQRGAELPADGREALRLRLGVAAAAGAAVALHVLTGGPSAGLAATVLVVVAAALLVRPCLHAGAPLLASAAQRLGGPAVRLATDVVLRNQRRSALAISMLGVSLGSVLWLWTVASSFERSVLELLPGKLRGDLSVTSANTAGYVETPVHERLLAALQDVRGVDIVAGEQVATWRFAGGPIAVNAYDPAYFTDPRFAGWRFVGRVLPNALAAVAQGDGAIVSENLVRNLGVEPGDAITLETPSGPLRLRAVAAVTDFLSPRGTITLSRAVYARMWRDDQVVRALVKVAPGASSEAVAGRIRDALAGRIAVRVLSIGALMDWFAERVRQAFGALHVLAALVIVVVLVGIGDVLAAGMLERTRELGLARAIGVRRAVLGRAVLMEALILGMLGLALACALGLGLGVLWVECTFPALLGWTLDLHVPFGSLAWLAVAAAVVCTGAAYLPAARATRLDPALALRAD